MQYAPLSRMLGRMNEASPIDPTTATEVTAAPAAAIGVLLVNLGTPDAADAPAVRRYLKEFLSDPRVIENQGVVWKAVLNGIILPIRPRIKEVFRVLMGLRRQPTVRVAAPYYDDKVYIDALATSMRDALGKLTFEPEMILASYHGMPEEYVRKGDPYEKHCIETTRLLRAALGMTEDKLMLTFQSRFGRAKWLEPATDHTVKALGKRGVKSLAVVTPGFSADCLETLEEIAVENAHIFRKAGGENFAAIPCLNDSAPGMLLLEDMARRELKGWV
jgi:protoheme ferro-lyase